MSQQTYWFARNLAIAGAHVHVVTNASEVEADHRMFLPPQQQQRLTFAAPGGGFVALHGTVEASNLQRHIPYGNPFVSKLAAKAIDVVRAHGCNVIWASYLEPYGVAAQLAAHRCGLPYVVRHAGSDISYLAQLDDRATVYREVLRDADLVNSGGATMHAIASLGVQPERFFTPRFAAFAPDWSGLEDGPAMDIQEVLAASGGTVPVTPFDVTVPTIGFYGKVGGGKGIFEVIEALGRLRQRGYRFQIASLSGLHGPRVANLREAQLLAQVSEWSYVLPFVPPWMVPSFIRACTYVCALEHDFPVPIHTPQLAMEILRCGTALICSREVHLKSFRGSALVDGVHALVVDNPRRVDEVEAVLQKALDTAANAAAMGAAGRVAVQSILAQPNASEVVDRLANLSRSHAAMSLMQFQRAMGDLYCSRSARAAADLDIDAFVAGYAVDPAERAALTQLLHQSFSLVKNLGQELLQKKLYFLRSIFPHALALLEAAGVDVEATFSEHYDFTARGPQSEIECLHELLGHMAQAGSDRPLPPWFDDVRRYEMLVKSADIDGPNDGTFDELPRFEIAPRVAALELHTPVGLARGVQLCEFSYPVAQLEATTASLTASPSQAVITPRFGFTPVKVHVVAAPVLAALRRLDAPVPVQQWHEAVCGVVAGMAQVTAAEFLLLAQRLHEALILEVGP